MENTQKSRQLSKFLSQLGIDFNQQLITLILNHCDEGIVLSDANNKIISVNNAFTRIMGFSAEEVVGGEGKMFRTDQPNPHIYEQFWHQVNEQGFWEGEMWVRRKNGETFPEWLVFSAIENKATETTYYLAMFSDISERKASAERIQFLTYHDPLTHLPNRVTLTNQLTTYVEKSKNNHTRTALFLINLDHFTNINITFGLSAGDMALRSIATRLRTCLQGDDLLVRLGGDEFAVLVPQVKSLDSLGHIAEKILQTLARPFTNNSYEFNISASIGISVFPDDAHTLDDLVNSAHASLRQVKQNGGKNYKFSTQDMQTNVRMRLMLENQLRVAIEKRELELHYQPLVDLTTGHICGLEALARWYPTGKNPIPPNEFIPIAEETGLIIPLTDWALTQACQDSTAWSQQGINPPPISVNVSALYFEHEDFQQRITDILQTENMSTSRIKLELTETAVMQHIESARKIFSDLKAAGIRIVIDDFGTGYSSLSYIKYFSFDQFKIDISFIEDIETSEDARIITRAIISLAKSLGISVVAEGVETAAQVEFLQKNHCDIGQGYYFSKPIPASKLTDLLKNPRNFVA